MPINATLKPTLLGTYVLNRLATLLSPIEQSNLLSLDCMKHETSFAASN